jgi:hypothetical protein
MHGATIKIKKKIIQNISGTNMMNQRQAVSECCSFWHAYTLGFAYLLYICTNGKSNIESFAIASKYISGPRH